MTSRWSDDASVPRGADYDARWERLAAAGQGVHGEADLVWSLLGERRGACVLDAGCGTGRVAIELARRGAEVVGTDLDPGMLDRARAKAPDLPWVGADLARLDLGRSFDLAVAAGNVLIFVAPGTEGEVVARLADHLAPGGLLVCGFQVRPGGYGPTHLDRDAEAAGLSLDARWATWDREPYDGGDYQVSVHRRG